MRDLFSGILQKDNILRMGFRIVRIPFINLIKRISEFM